jgi:hypothetical protein
MVVDSDSGESAFWSGAKELECFDFQVFAPQTVKQIEFCFVFQLINCFFVARPTDLVWRGEQRIPPSTFRFFARGQHRFFGQDDKQNRLQIEHREFLLRFSKFWCTA